MLEIHKFRVDPSTKPEHYMHRPVDIRHLGIQHGAMFLWIEVDTGTAQKPRDVYVIGTGWPIPSNCRYGGTVITPEGFVWHAYMPENEFGVRTY